MSNNLLTDQHITAEAMMILENELSFLKSVNRKIDKEFKGPAKRGATVFAKKPPRYTVRDGQNVSIQDTTITQVPVTLNHQFGIDVEFTSSELALSIDGFGEQVLQPAIAQLANTLDFTGLQLAATAPNLVGAPGTTPGTGATPAAALAVYAQSQALLDKYCAPRDGNRNILLNEDAQAVTVPNLAGLLSPTDEIGSQYKTGTMGKALGVKWSMSQNVAVATTGALGGTPLVATAPTAASGPGGTTLSTSGTTFSVATKGWTASTQVLNAGDVVSFATVFGVNPLSKQNFGKLKQFIVLSNVTSDGSGNATLSLGELMITTGAYQNVTNVPAINAPIYVNTSGTTSATGNVVSPQNLAYHRDAITFASVELPLPQGVHMAARRSDDQVGVSMRFVAAYNVSTDQFIGRFDILCGWAFLRPEWLVRIAG